MILEDRRSRPNSSGASTHYERAVADIDRRAVSAPDAATTIADLLAAASRAWGTAASGPLCPEIAGRSTRPRHHVKQAAPIVDARYLMTGSPRCQPVWRTLRSSRPICRKMFQRLVNGMSGSACGDGRGRAAHGKITPGYELADVRSGARCLPASSPRGWLRVAT